MSITMSIRRADDRGRSRTGWLDSRHTFSFGEYHDPVHMGFGPLRVMNEDIVAPGHGFAMHAHRDMEIISYVLTGELKHDDSLGHSGVIHPGEIQRISAGTGLLHSEVNPSPDTPVHFLQIWIRPSVPGGRPAYDQWSIRDRVGDGKLGLIVSPDSRQGAMSIRQDARIFAGVFPRGGVAAHRISASRCAWVQMARGGATLNGEVLKTGDGAACTGEGELTIRFEPGAEVLVMDLPSG